VPAISDEFGMSAFVVGRINWAYMLPYGLVALVYGPLTRAFDNKHIAIASLGFFSIFSFLSGIASSYASLFFYRFMVGIFAAAITPLSLIYIAEHSHESSRGKMVGFFFSATFVADLIGLFLSGIVPWRVMFFIPSILGIIAVYFTAKKFPHVLAGKSRTGARYISALKDKTILRAFVYIFMVSLLYHGVRQWLGVYFADELGMKQFFVSITLTLVSLAGIFGEAFGGLWSDKKGRIVTLKSGLLLMVISVFFLIFVRSFAVIPILMLLWGFGWTVNHSGVSTFLTDLNKDFMKEISSLNSSVRFVAGGAGVMAAGYLMQMSFKFGFLVYFLLLTLLFLSTNSLLAKRIN